MNTNATEKHIAVIGSGPSCLFLLKSLLDKGHEHFTIDIFEAGNHTGKGFPYSHTGAAPEHITNVSGNEIPPLVTSTSQWMKSLTPAELAGYGIDASHFNNYRVFPRLLFGEYLHAQFKLLLKKAAENNISINIHLNSKVTDIITNKENERNNIVTGDKTVEGFTHVIICSGHFWPATHEGKHPGYYDSPYPPQKISGQFNHPVAIKGSSLTAIDAVRTLAKQHGLFARDKNNALIFSSNENAKDFRVVMHSLHGLLPAIRFHLDDPRLSDKSLLSEEEIECHRKENDGFLSLDFIFEKDFKEPLRKKDPVLYRHIKDMSIESFVAEIMNKRERTDPFRLLYAEYEEANRSIQQHQSVHWKEILAILSYAMNHPAKHFSAEDMQRLQKVLMPLISVIIAFVPQDSCEELFALYTAGILSIVPVERDSHVDINPDGGIFYHYTDEDNIAHSEPYKTFIDCTGQPHLWIKDFPFKTLVNDGIVSQATLRFRSKEKAQSAAKEDAANLVEEINNQWYLKVPGIAINDNFNVVAADGLVNQNLYMMAVPFIGGYNPDYSGLDFCEAASGKIVDSLFK